MNSHDHDMMMLMQELSTPALKEKDQGLNGTLTDDSVHTNRFLVPFNNEHPKFKLVRAVWTVYRPPSMACTWHPLYLGFHLIAVAPQKLKLLLSRVQNGIYSKEHG